MSSQADFPPKAFHRILIIDDDSTSTYLAKITLDEMAIAEQVISFSDGEEGLNYIEQYCINEGAASAECPDLILLDINMPRTDGYDILEQLQTIGLSNLIRAKVVILSSTSYWREQERMKAYGVKDFLTKPITEVKVLSLMEKD